MAQRRKRILYLYEAFVVYKKYSTVHKPVIWNYLLSSQYFTFDMKNQKYNCCKSFVYESVLTDPYELSQCYALYNINITIEEAVLIFMIGALKLNNYIHKL